MSVSAPTRTPAFPEVLSLLLEHAFPDLHVSIPGRVENVDPVKGLADVKPLIQGWGEDDTGERNPISFPVIPGVPVQWQGGGGFRSTYPLKKGDTGLLIFTDRGLDRWKSLGGEVDPQNYRSHHLADAVFQPGLRSVPDALQTNPTDRATFGSDTGSRVEVLQSRINLGAGATHPVVRGDNYQSHASALASAATALQTAMSALQTALTTLGGNMVTALPGPNAAGAATAAGAAATAAGSAATAAGNIASAATNLSNDISTEVFTK